MPESSAHTITKKHISERIAEKTNMKRHEVKALIELFFEEVITELEAGNRLEFRDFGVFSTKARASRPCQNPRTLKPILVPAKRSIKFKPGRRMRDRVEANLPGALTEPKPYNEQTNHSIGAHAHGDVHRARSTVVQG